MLPAPLLTERAAEATMDKLIQQLGQDLASAGYAKRTQEKYVAAAKELSAHFKIPIADITREQVREFVEEISARECSISVRYGVLSGLRSLYCKTIGKPEMVSFIRVSRSCWTREHRVSAEIHLRHAHTLGFRRRDNDLAAFVRAAPALRPLGHGAPPRRCRAHARPNSRRRRKA